MILTISYFELLKLASPETIVVITALAVLAIGLVIAIGTVLVLPRNVTLFGGMFVITPLTSLFKIICIALSFFTVLLTTSEKEPRHLGEYLALVLFATVGLMLLVGSEELLLIFIGLELLGLSLYV